MDGFRIKFVRVAVKLLEGHGLAKNLYKDIIKAKRKEIYGVALFRFIDEQLGAMLMLFDLHKDGAYKVGSLGFIAVSVSLAEPVDSVPRLEIARLFVPCMLLRECRKKLLQTGVIIPKEDTELNFLQPCYERILAEITNLSARCRNDNERAALWDMYSKKIAHLERNIRELCNEQSKAAIAEFEKASHEFAEAVFEDKQQVQNFAEACRILIELREPMFESRNDERCLLQLEFSINGEKIVKCVDKEMLYLLGNHESDLLFNQSTKMRVSNRSIHTLSQINTAIEVLYGFPCAISVEDTLCIYPLFAHLDCEYVTEKMYENLERECRLCDVQQLLETADMISNEQHKEPLRELAKKLLSESLKNNDANIMKLLKQCAKVIKK